jgi:hypothetical protein
MHPPIRSCLLAVAIASLCAPGDAHAEVTVTISGTTAIAEIRLPNAAMPVYSATLRLDFDTPENLTADNLGVSAAIVDPLDPMLLARLPGGGSPVVSIPPAFPVLITVEPPAGAVLFAGSFEAGQPSSDELSFRRAADIEVRTTQLPYASDSPLRLLKSPVGGSFSDITADIVPGSVRTRARSGTYSEFLIVEDTRANDQRAIEEYDRAALRIADPAIAPPVATALAAALASSRSAFDAGDYALALSRLAMFDGLLAASAPVDVPDRWRARRDLNNAHGEIAALSATIAFFLRRLEND